MAWFAFLKFQKVFHDISSSLGELTKTNESMCCRHCRPRPSSGLPANTYQFSSVDTLLQAAVDKLLSTGVVSRVDLDETEGKKRRLQNFQTWHKFDIFNTCIRV